jgi:Ras-related protein Rab-1A
MTSNNAKAPRCDLKIIVVGNSGTGKTSFVNKWTKNAFNESYKATIVSEFGYKILEKDGRLYRIQLWDLAGQDKNTCITKIFCKDAHGVVIVADITNKLTLDE